MAAHLVLRTLREEGSSDVAPNCFLMQLRSQVWQLHQTRKANKGESRPHWNKTKMDDVAFSAVSSGVLVAVVLSMSATNVVCKLLDVLGIISRPPPKRLTASLLLTMMCHTTCRIAQHTGWHVALSAATLKKDQTIVVGLKVRVSALEEAGSAINGYCRCIKVMLLKTEDVMPQKIATIENQLLDFANSANFDAQFQHSVSHFEAQCSQ
eukprot:4514453-Amphidinium_carterae.1